MVLLISCSESIRSTVIPMLGTGLVFDSLMRGEEDIDLALEQRGVQNLGR